MQLYTGDSPKTTVPALKPAGSAQGLDQAFQGAALVCAMPCQHHCHLSACRNVSVLSSTLKHGIPFHKIWISVLLLPFTEDLYQNTYKKANK